MRVPIPKIIRSQVLLKFDGRCAYCGLESDSLQVDHVEPVIRHWRAEDVPIVNDPKNLMPACPSCNNFKATHDLEQFRRQIESQVERARKYSVNFRFAERFGLIAVTNEPVRFHFERAG